MSHEHLQLVIVDDDDDVRSAVHDVAQATFPSAEIVDYASSLQAIQRVQSGAADLLITNCHMPDMDGPTLVRTLREHCCALPIVMVSGSSDARELGERAGIDSFVHKQFMAGQLPEVLRSLLESR